MYMNLVAKMETEFLWRRFAKVGFVAILETKFPYS
jgi:hypothetical protein